MSKEYDILIIGSGIAGLMYALKTAHLGRVAIITKKNRMDTSTNYAQGGIASVFSKTDSFENHINDTIKTGGGICDSAVVEKVIKSGPRYINELAELGVKFTRKRGQFDLGREGGHSQKRVVHSADHTGRNIENALLESLAKHKNIDLYENNSAIDIITQHQLGKETPKSGPSCYGVYVYDNQRMQVETFHARLTLLATGGAGYVYQHTTNPGIATGDGIAMAYRAGVKVANLEFVQFHPTRLYAVNEEPFLITEAVRGEGGLLISSDGRRFMEGQHKMAELAPRDVVARAIDMVLKQTGDDCVYLDITNRSKSFLEERFPTIVGKCRSIGIDPAKEPIPVVPAAHYFCGGALTDLNGCTSMKYLLAAGEVACTGMHGANRLASNSLLEAVAFADFAAEWTKKNFAKIKKRRKHYLPDWDESKVFDHKEWVVVSHDQQTIRNLMWDYVGIVRSNNRLNKAYDRCLIMRKHIEQFYRKNPIRPEVLQLRNIADVALMLIRCALKRKESRGLHYNIDYPDRDDKNYKHNTIIQRNFNKEK
ncbi:MAG: L-aspartate oxidase [candidate division Zixibacteria bacterium]|nr:L-aspartate oxidase [candidate division Zixibacteria bacterium]